MINDSTYKVVTRNDLLDDVFHQPQTLQNYKQYKTQHHTLQLDAHTTLTFNNCMTLHILFKQVVTQLTLLDSW